MNIKHPIRWWIWLRLTDLRDVIPERLCRPVDWLRYSKWLYTEDHWYD